MCLIIAVPKGVEDSKDAVLSAISNSIINNKDGAGFAVKTSSGISMSKGFIKEEDLVEALSEAINKVPEEEEFELVVHLRRGNIGGLSDGMCHPFPCTDDEDKLEAVDYVGNDVCFMAHNGTFLNVGVDKYYSDTYKFTKTYLSNPHLRSLFFQNPNIFKDLLSNKINNSRVVLMSPDSEQEMVKIGTWIEKDGIFYSNDSYKDSKIINIGGSESRQMDHSDLDTEYENEIKGLTTIPTYTETLRAISIYNIAKRVNNIVITKDGNKYYEYLAILVPVLTDDEKLFLESYDLMYIVNAHNFKYLRVQALMSDIHNHNTFVIERRISNDKQGLMYIIRNTKDYSVKNVPVNNMKTDYCVRFKMLHDEERMMYLDLAKSVSPNKHTCKRLSECNKYKHENARVNIKYLGLNNVRVSVIRMMISNICSKLKISEIKFLDKIIKIK